MSKAFRIMWIVFGLVAVFCGVWASVGAFMGHTTAFLNGFAWLVVSVMCLLSSAKSIAMLVLESRLAKGGMPPEFTKDFIAGLEKDFGRLIKVLREAKRVP